MKRALRVLVTPREIAGVASGLQDALGRRGHQVDVLLRWQHPFAYAVRASRSALLRRLAPIVLEAEGGSRTRRILSLIARVLLLPFIALRYDAVVYIGPDTLLRGGPDRRLLRRLGVTTVTVFCGSDARPAYLDGWYAGAGSPASLPEARAAVTRTRERLQQAERDSAYVVNHAGSAQFHLSRFLDWTVVGFAQRENPLGRNDFDPATPQPQGVDRPLRVLHAPSDLRMKGTLRIRAAIAELKTDGLSLDYVEVTGRAHAEVQDMLRGADLVVDQLYSDAVLPGLASEAARVGTAVLVCGYAGNLVADAARRTGAPTAHYADPGDLVGRLRRLLTDHKHRADVAAALHDFVTTGHWSSEAIGSRWESILTRRPDGAWFDEPAEVVYPHGCAVSAEDRAAFLRRYVEQYGIPALELGHHPALVTALRETNGF